MVSTDDAAVLASCDDRIDEAPLTDATFECLELVLADVPWVADIGSQAVNRHLLNDH